VRLRDLL